MNPTTTFTLSIFWLIESCGMTNFGRPQLCQNMHLITFRLGSINFDYYFDFVQREKARGTEGQSLQHLKLVTSFQPECKKSMPKNPTKTCTVLRATPRGKKLPIRNTASFQLSSCLSSCLQQIQWTDHIRQHR